MSDKALKKNIHKTRTTILSVNSKSKGNNSPTSSHQIHKLQIFLPNNPPKQYTASRGYEELQMPQHTRLKTPLMHGIRWVSLFVGYSKSLLG